MLFDITIDMRDDISETSDFQQHQRFFSTAMQTQNYTYIHFKEYFAD